MKLRTIKYFFKRKLFNVFYKLPKVLNDIETIDYIIKNKCSISRFGDGELNLMMGFDIPFQSCNDDLIKKLKQVKNTENCLACVPNVFDYKKYKSLVVEEEFRFWNFNRKKFIGIWKRYFHNNDILGDAFISRFYMRKKDKTNINIYVDKLKLLWDSRNVVFIEGENLRLGYGNDLFDNAKSIRRILCPSKNAFDKYDKIIESIKKNVNEDDLLILALGPTATVLAYDLSELGYQALDLGHIDVEYEWYKMGAQEKCPIPHKHVNECKSLGNDDNLDNKYFEEIICKV